MKGISHIKFLAFLEDSSEETMEEEIRNTVPSPYQYSAALAKELEGIVGVLCSKPTTSTIPS